MLKSIRAAALAVAITGGLAAFAQPASASTVLTFTDIANASSGGASGYASQGYKITPSTTVGYAVHGKTNPFNADLGGATLTHNQWNMESIFTRTDGGLFDFLSIDVSDYYNSTAAMDLVFTFTDGLGVVTTQTLRTDSLKGLQTLTFNRKGLSRFTMNSPANWVQFDNVVLDQVVSGVPEPSTWAMMLVGFFTAGSALRSRRRIAIA